MMSYPRPTASSTKVITAA